MPKMIQFDSIASLSDALIRAKDAHAEFERGLGQHDSQWPLWYAGFMAMEQGLGEPGSRVAEATKPHACRVTFTSPVPEPQVKAPGDLPHVVKGTVHRGSSWGFGTDDGSVIETTETDHAIHQAENEGMPSEPDFWNR